MVAAGAAARVPADVVWEETPRENHNMTDLSPMQTAYSKDANCDLPALQQLYSATASREIGPRRVLSGVFQAVLRYGGVGSSSSAWVCRNGRHRSRPFMGQFASHCYGLSTEDKFLHGLTRYCKFRPPAAPTMLAGASALRPTERQHSTQRCTVAVPWQK